MLTTGKPRSRNSLLIFCSRWNVFGFTGCPCSASSRANSAGERLVHSCPGSTGEPAVWSWTAAASIGKSARSAKLALRRPPFFSDATRGRIRWQLGHIAAPRDDRVRITAEQASKVRLAAVSQLNRLDRRIPPPILFRKRPIKIHHLTFHLRIVRSHQNSSRVLRRLYQPNTEVVFPQILSLSCAAGRGRWPAPPPSR